MVSSGKHCWEFIKIETEKDLFVGQLVTLVRGVSGELSSARSLVGD